MANIKILKEDQLVGGTDNTPVYPVSSTQAIYCQDSEGNVPQGVKPKLEDRLRDIENSMEASNYVIIRGQTIHVGTASITVPSTASEVNALPNTTKYGYSFDLDLNTSTYVLTITLKDQDGTSLVSKNVDFPMESTVVNGSYNSQLKKIVLTLKNNNTIDIPVADLISGLQSEITPVSPLDADLVDDTNSTHKFVTEQEKQAWTNKSGFSGNYNDLSGKPTNVSSFTNDAGYLTSTDIEQELGAKANTSDVYDKTTIDTALTSKQNTPLIIEVNYDSPSIPNGTYASITAALAAGKEVIVKLNNPLYTINCHLKGVANSVYTFTSSFMVAIVNVIINPNDTISVNSDSVALESHLDGKVDKVEDAVSGNLAVLTSDGNIADSGLALSTKTAYSNKGSATKVPKISTNTLGQVTSISEVTITQPTVPDISTSISSDGASDTKTASPKAVKTYVDTATAGIVTSSTTGLKIEVVASLPANPDSNTIYIVQ